MSNIASGNTIAEVAALIGDPARANILAALMGGQALTATELAWHAGVTAQTTSSHLAKLNEACLIALEKQGRHRYYRLATAEVAQAIHSLMVVAASGPKRYRPVGPRDEALRLARTCYDHIGGRLALALADSFRRREYVTLADGCADISAEGMQFFAGLGLDAKREKHHRRPLCRTCLDWSERRPHLSGWLGSALLERFLAEGWLARIPESRALAITPAGLKGFVGKAGLPPEWQNGKYE